MSNFRDRFEEEVNRIGVTQISNMLGVARNTIYNWMAKGNVPLNSLMGLHGLLGMDVQYVLFGERASDLLGPDEQMLLKSFRGSTKPLRDAAMRVLGCEESPPSNDKPPSKAAGMTVTFAGENKGTVAKTIINKGPTNFGGKS